MTRGRRPLAVGAAALALLVGCSGSDPPLADPDPATGSHRPERTAGPQRPDPAASGLDAARGFRSTRLGRGDEIKVSRADRSSARFVVERTAQYDKQRFPTDDVYYPTLTPALRLVTCGGQFDTSTGHYRSNIIVFATLRT
jgi:hypothetical protein